MSPRSSSHRSPRAQTELLQRYQHLMQAAPVWFWAANPSATEIHLASPGAKALTGYEPEEFIRDPGLWFRIIPEEDRPIVIEANERARRDKVTTSFECRIRRKDGALRWMYDVVIPECDQAGNLTGVYGFALDVTDRKEAERALARFNQELEDRVRERAAQVEESQRALSMLIGNLPGMVYRCRNDRDWTIEFMSEGCTALTGYAPADFLQRRVSFGKDVIHPDDQEPVWSDVQTALNERRSYQLTYRIRTRTGEEKWVWEQGGGVYAPDGALLALEGFTADITEHRRIERENAVRARQHAAVAGLGQLALAGADLTQLMNQAVRLAAECLNVELCKVLEWLPESHALLLRAGVGWDDGMVGRATVPDSNESQAGYTLLSSAPVVVENLQTESRFKGPALLLKHGVVSGVSVAIMGRVRPYGVLGAHTAQRREFSKDDTNFLQSVANVLAEAIERKRVEGVLRENERTMSTLVANLPGYVYRCKNDSVWTVEFISEGVREVTGYAADEYLRRTITCGEKTHPEDRERVWQEVQQALGQRRSFETTYRIRTKSGEERWLWERGQGIFSSDGTLHHIEGFVTDVTKAKRAELERVQTEAVLAELSSAVEQTADSVFITDRAGVVQYVNPSFEAMTGYAKHEVIGENARLLKSGYHPARFYETLWKTILDGHVFRAVFINRKKSGDTYYEEKIITPIKDRDGRITHFVSTGRDITERTRAEEARERLAAVLEVTTDFVGTTDADGRFLFINKAGRAIVGIDQKASVSSMQIVDCHPPWASTLILNEAIPRAVQHGVWSGETALLTRDGREIPVSQVILAHKAADGTVEYISTIARDISERKAQTAALEYQATHDALTALPNRNLLHDRLRQAILSAQREHHALALLVLDLDRFKEINDTLGHHHGDLLLKEVGPRLRAALRESDTIARLGGDEFAVLLPSADQEGAVMTAQKILQALERPFLFDELVLDVEASIGIALFPEHGLDAETILRKADVAMYMAKQAGSGYALYASEHDQYSHRRLSLMGELRHAIEREQLFLHYQPTVNLASGQVIGVEALLRWQHPKHGLVPPEQFIPLAEQTGLIKPLTEMVVVSALRHCHGWQQAGIRLSVSVNLSARTLHDPTFPDQIDKLLTERGVPPRLLELELTESAIMADPDRAMEILSCLSIMGVRLAIDDFGVGHSSLAYLKKLPVHEIKIDKSFVLNMDTDPDDVMIVRSIIDLGHSQGLKVVAEGVRSQAALDRLVELGCDSAQGYFISQPIPVDALLTWMHNSPWTVTKV
ncbi:MAG: EAL domain-containing protein [Nitrospirota bacterium]